VVMSRDLNAGQNHNIKISNNYCERVEQFRYLGTTVTNQNLSNEESKSRLKLGKTCYHSVQNLVLQSAIQKDEH
jgi:hypothetical protein